MALALVKGQTIEILQDVNKQLKAGTRWVVTMAADNYQDGRGETNVLLAKLSKGGWPMKWENNAGNLCGIQNSTVERLVETGMVEVVRS